ncbi:F-box protein 2 [Striga asiatica]|uniref:F-box protein 2 n=1 Tax=Striga asiatica TaxID=4170 RepID=A0A5A7RII8_STRAF|nr:F-box protein 2 [Striga asiatica]
MVANIIQTQKEECEANRIFFLRSEERQKRLQEEEEVRKRQESAIMSDRKLEESDNLEDALTNLGIHSTSFTNLHSMFCLRYSTSLTQKIMGSFPVYKLASEHHSWKELYRERWAHPIGLGKDGETWKNLYVERDIGIQSFMESFEVFSPSGYSFWFWRKETVRTICVLVSEKLLFLSGDDKVVRMYELNYHCINCSISTFRMHHRGGCS